MRYNSFATDTAHRFPERFACLRRREAHIREHGYLLLRRLGRRSKCLDGGVDICGVRQPLPAHEESPRTRVFHVLEEPLHCDLGVAVTGREERLLASHDREAHALQLGHRCFV